MPGSPILGAQATSRTQSSCALMTSSSAHFFPSSSKLQMRIRLSEPADTNRFCMMSCAVEDEDLLGLEGFEVVDKTDGAQLTAFAPVP